MRSSELGDAGVQATIAQFIGEARRAAKTPFRGGVLGIPAMSTIFSCVVSVGEALSGERKGDRILIERFYQEMKDKRSWLIPPIDTLHNDDVACTVLEGTRNSLAHALAMPKDVLLQADRGAVRGQFKGKWQLLVLEFINAVEQTIADLTERHPQLSFEKVVDEEEKERGLLGVGLPAPSCTTVARPATGDSAVWDKRSSTPSTSITLKPKEES